MVTVQIPSNSSIDAHYLDLPVALIVESVAPEATDRFTSHGKIHDEPGSEILGREAGAPVSNIQHLDS